MTQIHAPSINLALSTQVAVAAQASGLFVQSSEASTDFCGDPTTRYTLQLPSHPGKRMTLELWQSFDFAADLQPYLAESAKRLRNPRPDCYLTLSGLPLRFDHFAWPFHESTAGADTSLVHGQIDLADGTDSPLHAKIAASMTVTFREIVKAPEQPFAEGFIYNAIRKTMDQGQLELVKSGNRQPVPVTTRYYSMRNKKFSFNDTVDSERTRFLAAKAFWLSGVLGQNEPVWLIDPRDAQYLNATVDDLRKSVQTLAAAGSIVPSGDGEYASPTEALMRERPAYEATVAEALAFIKPTFNEDMRGGHTNM